MIRFKISQSTCHVYIERYSISKISPSNLVFSWDEIGNLLEFTYCMKFIPPNILPERANNALPMLFFSIAERSNVLSDPICPAHGTASPRF